MRNATLALAALAMLIAAPQAVAQCTGTPGEDFFQVTVDQINEIPQANIDQLNDLSAAGTIAIGDIQSLLTNDLEGEVVEFTAAILSDPLLSGLATAVNGIPGRIHVFVRDVAAATAPDGPAGMTTQIVDNRGDGQIQQFFVGDEIVVCGIVAPFTGTGGKNMQITPISITGTGNAYGSDDPLLQPVLATISDFHDAIGDQTQLNFDTFSDFNSQYVRLETTTVVQGVVNGARVDLLYSSDDLGGAPQINQYDTSVCFRNDRDATYFPPGQAPACIDDDFVPPATGTINIQGFLTFQGDDGGFNYGSPDGGHFVINPMEESDFEIASAPPIVSVSGPDFIPAPADNVTIAATVVAGQGTIQSVALNYEYIRDGSSLGSGSVPMANTSGDGYEGAVPALAGSNGAFVVYSVTANDDSGGSTTTPDQSYLVFEGSIDSISRIQTTADGGPGDSPLATGSAATFDLDAVVQSIFQIGSGGNYIATLQDDETLAPFTGIWVFFGSADPGLSPGDRINITEATVSENFNVTQLTNVTFTETGSGTPYAYKEVTTDLFNGTGGASTGEQHEGMLVSFDNVTVVATNADAPAGPFGEFLFSSDGTAANGVRADDYSNAITYTGNDPDELLDEGDVLDFVRGPLYFSFGNYKVTPVSTDDIGAVVSANEGGIEARSIRILGTSPNPATAMARIAFELDAAGPAALRVFDVTGREVAVVAEGVYPAAAHTAELNTGALAPGVYVVRLEAGGEIATARLAVVR